MPVGSCNMCFKRAEVKEIVPNVSVCKACGYALNKNLDFWQYYGYGLQKLQNPSHEVGNEQKTVVNTQTGEIEPANPSKIEKEGVKGSKSQVGHKNAK